MRTIIAIVIAVFALSGCVALPITFGIAQVGMGFSNGDPSAAPDTECPPPMTVGCEAEHDNAYPGAEQRSEPPPNGSDDEPDRDDPEEPDSGKPGWGHGDKNHDHSGPPGQNK